MKSRRVGNFIFSGINRVINNSINIPKKNNSSDISNDKICCDKIRYGKMKLKLYIGNCKYVNT